MSVRYGDKPWERQKGESAKAYEAFKCCIDMGTGVVWQKSLKSKNTGGCACDSFRLR